ncbi:hypothetical protein ERO13_D12G009400v2 [Gossypium hirsutum]|uniref:Uncharacterized protein n=3 Tax=Gossypium TaxID=3633 RepID=A0A5D2SA15_GOSMU|nr:hypothetical protein ERO13_D12G009400v2 [Gossypium hirsutum]TYG39365.1 hypothetical protein ES288_D12G010900v1 [Gossypium darwinii]TYH36986.1 hypothetical protein ES332_D12G009900v1 [Gossypium tomentosum]TYI49055.1 hypothetical protein E1A91_D12G009500v1 [Gossypium mustelinum]KAG4113858.1 hypothetical protein ERO13_D12G009400v2 [Gossypium hirsutum]
MVQQILGHKGESSFESLVQQGDEQSKVGGYNYSYRKHNQWVIFKSLNYGVFQVSSCTWVCSARFSSYPSLLRKLFSSCISFVKAIPFKNQQ